MDYTFNHSLTYDFDDQATMREIAGSLIANEKLIKDSFEILKICHPGLEISSLKVRLSVAQQQSPLKEIITAAIVFGFQEDLEEEVPEFIKSITGVEISEAYDSMVTTIVVAIALWGILSLIEKIFKRKTQAPETYNAYHNITNVAGNLIQVDPETIRTAITELHSGKKKKSTIRNARDFFLPAKRHRARKISAGRTTIPQSVIEEIPSDVDEQIFEPEREEYSLENVEVQLRAHDLDSAKAGWAGVVSVVSEKRTRVQIDPSIPSDALFTKEAVLADLRVYLVENEDGEMEPSLYIIKEIHSNEKELSATEE